MQIPSRTTFQGSTSFYFGRSRKMMAPLMQILILSVIKCPFLIHDIFEAVGHPFRKIKWGTEKERQEEEKKKWYLILAGIFFVTRCFATTSWCKNYAVAVPFVLCIKKRRQNLKREIIHIFARKSERRDRSLKHISLYTKQLILFNTIFKSRGL